MTALVALEVEAFKVFADRTSFRVAGLAPGLHQVRGANRASPRLESNGAGKSTLFSDAPTWCLYGRTVEGLRTSDVQAWGSKRRARVAITLRCIDGRERTVQRGPRASDLTVDGKVVGQEDVDALVGLSFDAWCQAVVFGQGQPLFFDLPPRAKMDLLAEALGLERWERRAEAAAARARRLEARRAGLEGEARGLEAALEHAQAAQRAAQIASERWAGDQAILLEKTAAALKSERARAAGLEARLGDASMASDRAGTAARLLRPDVEALRGALAGLEAECREANAQARRADDAVRALDSAAAALKKTGRCPECKQALSTAKAAAHAKELAARRKALTAELARADKSAQVALQAADRARKALKRDEPRLLKLEEAERKAEGDLRLLERSVGEARGAAAAAEADLRRTEAAENPHQQASQDARAQAKAIRRQIKEAADKEAALAASAERAQFWAKGFRDIRLGIIDDVLEDMREATASVLDRLGLGEWEVDYATERETKSGTTQRALAVVVRAPSTPQEGARWEAYSGGERQRLRLAGALALSEVLLAHAGVELDFRVLDEPTRGLSREGVRDLVDLLGDYARERELKIFYVDHHSEEGHMFASTIAVERGPRGASARAQKDPG